VVLQVVDLCRFLYRGGLRDDLSISPFIREHFVVYFLLVDSVFFGESPVLKVYHGNKNMPEVFLRK